MKALGIVEVPVFTMGVVEFIPYAKLVFNLVVEIGRAHV